MSETRTAEPVSRFLHGRDYERPEFRRLRGEFEEIYSNVLGKEAEAFGAKDPSATRIHWSRDWEYPWAILSSAPKAGHKVLDCGCGGSPLLPYLSRIGCDAYGVDPGLQDRSDPIKHAVKVFKDQVWAVRSRKASVPQALLGGLKRIRRPNDLWANQRDPNRMGFRIQYFRESLDRMHFEDGFFDRVYCISVIEHLPEDVAFRGMREMARVLKPGGLLVITADHTGEHVTPELRGGYQKLIEASGLKLHGETDFSEPAESDIPGEYPVVGFVLRKEE